jgi:metal-sulfur cluster biosynthetic enzyme
MSLNEESDVVRGAAGMPQVPTPRPDGKLPTFDDLEEAMRDVVDPELDMTLTSAACPLTDVIEDQTRAALTSGPGGGLVDDVRINWVWIPPWGPDKITEDGRDQLRALGFTV